MTSTSDHASFLQAILARPDEDAPRLIYADWLEEQGESDRAEFIRVQCELARHEDARKLLSPNNPYPEGILLFSQRRLLRLRETELLERHGHDWISKDWTDVVNHSPMLTVPVGWNNQNYIFRRGFLAEIHCTLAEFCGGPCGTCLGDFVGRDDGRDGKRQMDATNGCKRCRGHGTLPGHGPAIVAAHPVEIVRATDAVIHASGGNDTYYVGGLGSFPQEYWSQLEDLPSRQAAMDAISCVLILMAKAENKKSLAVQMIEESCRRQERKRQGKPHPMVPFNHPNLKE